MKFRTFPFLLFLLVAPLFSYPQQTKLYENDYLPKEFHKDRREEVRKRMPDSTAAVFFASPVRNRANDVDFDYHQDPNFYYLTGYNEPNAVLLLFKEAQVINGVRSNEFIFVQNRNPQMEIWTGKRLGKEGVRERLRFEAVYLNSDFDSMKFHFERFKNILHLPLPVAENNPRDKADLYDLVEQFKSKLIPPALPSTGKKKSKKEKEITPQPVPTDRVLLSKIMSSLREVKSVAEMILLRKAIDITVIAQIELMKALAPGMTEYQAQAIIEYIYKKYGSEYPGFPSILGGGENSCILHYTSNRKLLLPGDLLVVDIGAEYHGYTADVTRTMPVDGIFSPEEKAIYELVLKAQEAGIKVCKAGVEFRAAGNAATDIIKRGLVELGITKDTNEYRNYFMHGTSHYLGLDVHDAGTYGKLPSGSVITVEPGIYIPAGSPCDPKWWNIGVRIEDDVLIMEDGCEVLSIGAPRSVAEIEKLMKEVSLFNQVK